MEKFYSDTRFSGYSGFGRNPRHRGWKTFLKVCCWILGILIVLFVGVVIWINAYFTPERLSKMISKEASEYINGEVKVSGLNYKLFSTFPELHISIDSLKVVSGAFKNLNQNIKEELPENADILLTTGEIRAALNIRKLMKGEIILSDILVASPYANLVIVNDTLNNFNIFPEMPKNMKKPDLSLGKVKLIAPITLSFADLEKEVSVETYLWNFDLLPGKDGFMDLDFKMSLKAKTPQLHIETPLEASVSGGLAFKASPLQVKADSLTINLAPVNLILSLDFDRNADRYVIESLDANINIPDVFSLPRYIPAELVELPKELDNITGTLPLDFKLSFNSPYILPDSIPSEFKLNILPDMVASLSVNNGDLVYEAGNGEKMEIEDIGLNVKMRYDPANPDACFVEIPELGLYSDGIHLKMNGRVDDVLSEEPAIIGSLEMRTRLEKSVSPVLASKDIKLSGDLEVEADFSIGLKEIKGGSLEDVQIKGDIVSSQTSIAIKKSGIKATLKGTQMDFDANMPLLKEGTTPTGQLVLNLKNRNLELNDNSLIVDMGGFSLKAKGGTLSPSTGSSAQGDLNLSIQSLDVSSAGAVVTLSGIMTNLKGQLLNVPNSYSGNCNTTLSNADEALLMQRVAHTPMWLIPQLPGSMAALYAMADMDIDLKIDAGRFLSPFYLATNLFSNLDISTNLDNVNIKSLRITSDNTSGDLSGNIDGLASFLNAGEASMLKVDLDIDFTNVDINRLAGAYYGAIEKTTGKPYDFTMPPQGPYTKADSICVLIPRNLEANIRLKSKSAEYMGYRFAPLSTDIILKNGDATLDRLTVGTPYCTAIVDWTYSTSSLNDIYMSLHADVDDFDFSRFFNVFPQLSDKAPEILNLTGNIGLAADASFRMFPSMFMEGASLQARFSLNGRDLEFTRKGKIERLTHLMMIKGDGPINISGLDVSGFLRDNVLLINPFHIKFDDYQVGLAGVNNLVGDMYYHIALEKSPFHMPFAVNLVGSFSHPEVRFGGTEIKDGREREIVSTLRNNIDVNIMTNLHRGWLMFVEEAAKYDLRQH